jgi:hypothetical protein
VQTQGGALNRGPHRLVTTGLAAIALLFTAESASATQYWELEPVKDPQVAVGTYTVIGGATTPDGVNFTLKNNKDTMPLAVTLIAKTPAQPIHISVFKEEEPFLEKDTDAKGIAIIRFRTADDVHFKLTGAAGATYQLAVWRGPEIAMPPPSPIATMASVVGAESGPPPAAKGAAYVPTAAPPSSSSSSSFGIGLYVLLGGILIALMAIAFLIYRGRTMGKKQ